MSIRSFQHRLALQPASGAQAIEFTWDDGTRTTLDANADWTLDLSNRPWLDPYAGATESERKAIADEVGLWEQAPTPGPLRRLVGQSVASATPEFNEVGELAGLRLVFGEDVVVARIIGGDLTVEVLGR